MSLDESDLPIFFQSGLCPTDMTIEAVGAHGGIAIGDKPYFFAAAREQPAFGLSHQQATQPLAFLIRAHEHREYGRVVRVGHGESQYRALMFGYPCTTIAAEHLGKGLRGYADISKFCHRHMVLANAGSDVEQSGNVCGQGDADKHR